MKFKFLERFFPKVFVGVWLNGDTYYVSTQRVTPSGAIESGSYNYDKDKEEDLLFKLLEDTQAENIVTYIGILDQSEFQGAVPTVKEHEYLNYSEIEDYREFEDIIFQTHSDKWTAYSLKSEIIHLQNRFKTSGFDYIFSPFFLPLVIQHRNRLIHNTSIFIIAEEELTLLAIFDGEQLLYGKFINDIDPNEMIIQNSEIEIEDGLFQNSPEDGVERDIEKRDRRHNQASSDFFEDEIDLGDLDVLPRSSSEKSGKDELDDELLSLDFLDDGDKFSLDNDKLDQEISLSIEDEKREKDDKTIDSEELDELEKFLDEEIDEESYYASKKEEVEMNYNLIYQVIKKGVDEFYNSELYQSDFIENCYFITSQKVSNSFLQKIESEFSFGVDKIMSDVSELIVELVREEVTDEI
jgi:hypothetical protein